jgi:hypothetical protein
VRRSGEVGPLSWVGRRVGKGRGFTGTSTGAGCPVCGVWWSYQTISYNLTDTMDSYHIKPQPRLML